MTFRQIGMARFLVVAGMLVLSGVAPAWSKDAVPPKTLPVQVTKPAAIDSGQLEREMQALSWPQFRSVVEAVPQLKAEVEKHGSAAWPYLKAKYKTYAWKKSIDRLADGDKRTLARLIANARSGR